MALCAQHVIKLCHNTPAPVNFTFFPGITPLPIQLTCDVTPALGWIVNSHPILYFQLASNVGYDYMDTIY